MFIKLETSNLELAREMEKKGYINTTEAEISDFQSLDPPYSNMQL